MAQSAICLVALCCLATALAAPAAAPGPVQAYQRPLNQDCIASLANNAPVTSGTINVFPQQFRIAGTTSNSAANRVTVHALGESQLVATIVFDTVSRST